MPISTGEPRPIRRMTKVDQLVISQWNALERSSFEQTISFFFLVCSLQMAYGYCHPDICIDRLFSAFVSVNWGPQASRTTNIQREPPRRKERRRTEHSVPPMIDRPPGEGGRKATKKYSAYGGSCRAVHLVHILLADHLLCRKMIKCLPWFKSSGPLVFSSHHKT